MNTAPLAVGLCAALFVGSVEANQSIRAYHLGNSVTDTFRYDGLGDLAASRGESYVWGRHMIPGAPLAWIYFRGVDSNNDGTIGDYSGFIDNPQAGPGATDAQKAYRGALPGYAWDALTLQPFDRQLGTPTGALNPPGDNTGTPDLPIAREMISLLRQNPANHDTTVYIYSRWPRRSSDTAPINYQQLWNRTYTGGWDGTNESRDYFEKVTLGTRQIVQNLGGSNPVYMIPVGDVLNEIDLRAEAGQIPGITDVVQLYADGIHLTNVGAYAVSLTFYATMYKSSPVGLPVPATYLNNGYGNQPPQPLSPATALALQQAVWSVVAGHPYSGVPIPEPTALTVLTGAGLIALRRRRAC